MFFWVLLSAGAPPVDPTLHAQLTYDPPAISTATYDLQVKLDPATKTFAGSGRVIWTNRGTRPLKTLHWHLYLNAFKNPQSTFMQESGGELRGDKKDADSWGWIHVDRWAAKIHGTDNQPVELTQNHFSAPDDQNLADQTVLLTPLPFVLEPGQKVEISLDFRAQLPQVFARSGWAGEFFMVAQWFPKLGVLEETWGKDPGLAAEPAWNCHQYHANSEFFADFGEYRVNIQVPENFQVGATGVLVETRYPQPGWVEHEYYAEKVHDFAWTADPNFIRLEKEFLPRDVPEAYFEEAAALLGMDPRDLELLPVKVILLIQPEHQEYAERYFSSVFSALTWLGLWLAPYPYPVLTVVDGPRGAGGAMGMEYPMLIAGGVTWPSPEDIPSPESVTIHELIHQFWYGLVASNEFEEAWLDEGFTQYFQGKVVDRSFGPRPYAPRLLGLPTHLWLGNVKVDSAKIARIGGLLERGGDQITRRSWEYRDDESYGLNSYLKTAWTFQQLEQTLGPQTLARIFRIYHRRFRYGHPQAKSFVQVANEVTGQDQAALFQRLWETAGKQDYAVGYFSSEPETMGGGFEDSPEGPKMRGSGTSTLGLYRTEVFLERRGDIAVPVTARVYFEEGPPWDIVWDGSYRWARFTQTSTRVAEKVELYPRGEGVLDSDRANDSKTLKPNHKPAGAWFAHILGVAQGLWQLIGGLL